MSIPLHENVKFLSHFSPEKSSPRKGIPENIYLKKNVFFYL